MFTAGAWSPPMASSATFMRQYGKSGSFGRTANHRDRRTRRGDWWKELISASERFDLEHLAAAIVTAGWAGDVRRDAAGALRAGLEDRGTPTGCATAHFRAAFGLAALWNSHGSKSLELVLEVLECVECVPTGVGLAAGGGLYPGFI